jgi:hypothetical protein
MESLTLTQAQDPHDDEEQSFCTSSSSTEYAMESQDWSPFNYITRNCNLTIDSGQNMFILPCP